MKKVLVTRPEGPAQKTFSQMIRANGAEPVFCPLSSIEFLPLDLNADDQYQALIITSSNAVRAAAQCSGLSRGISCFAVGDVTAALAREAGFQSVKSADGNVDALIDLIKATLDPTQGRLLYLRGEDVTGDLGGSLVGSGFKVDSSEVYKALWLEVLPDKIKFEINRGYIDLVSLLSPLTAENFTKLVRESETPIDLTSTKAICLSEAIAQGTDTLRWEEILVSPKPKLEDLVKLI